MNSPNRMWLVWLRLSSWVKRSLASVRKLWGQNYTSWFMNKTHNMNEKPIQNQHIRVFLHLILGRIMWDWIGINDLLHATLLDKCAIIMIWDHLLLLQAILDF